MTELDSYQNESGCQLIQYNTVWRNAVSTFGGVHTFHYTIHNHTIQSGQAIVRGQTALYDCVLTMVVRLETPHPLT